MEKPVSNANNKERNAETSEKVKPMTYNRGALNTPRINAVNTKAGINPTI
jgi:hypothetical protein